MSCGVVKPSNPRPPLVLGLRPKPRPIIAYEEDTGDHGSSKTSSRTTLSSTSQGRGRRRATYRQMQSPKAFQRKR